MRSTGLFVTLACFVASPRESSPISLRTGFGDTINEQTKYVRPRTEIDSTPRPVLPLIALVRSDVAL